MKMIQPFLLGLCFLLTLQFFANGSYEANQVTVEGVGIIRGTVLKSLNGREFLAFRGIPYAEPPVGDLRFKPPVAKLPWTESGQIYDATEDGPYCAQIQFTSFGEILGQEDCLYLNVYTHDTNKKTNKLKPVMVSIHGGGFFMGSGRSNQFGPRKLLDKDVVLVTINYRLSVFGFLSTSDEASPGNYGLLDQMEAMKWVKNNIQAFGGDPNSITIFGESAGGASVYYHILSPLSKGLFHRAIAMSGSPLAPWALRTNSLDLSKSLGKLLGCPISDSKALVGCLKEKPVKDLLLTSLRVSKSIMSFNPVIDGYFITDHPKSLFERGEIANKVPLLTGINKDEGLTFYGAFRMTPEPYSIEKIEEVITFALNVDEVTNEVREMVKNFYIQRFGAENEVKVLSEIFSDVVMKVPHYEAIKHLAWLGFKAYIYSYNYIGLNNIARFFKINATGVGHIEDLYILFDGELFIPQMENLNDPGTQKFLDLWVNFATYGDPTPAEVLQEGNVKWDSVKKDNFPICQLDNTISVTPYNKEDDKLIDFWSNKISNLMKLAIKDEL